MRKIYDTIQNYHMIEPGMLVLAGVSGGADSVCLLTALARYRRELPFELMAVHVEHGLRGAESLADAAYVEELCAKLEVELLTEHVDVAAAARERGLTVEEAGRAVRYEIFDRAAERYGADRIAVAHNQNDQAETMLWNLVRGSGLKGLGGIRPVRGRIIRPLLFLERTEIEQILTECGIGWRTDRTNLETEYTRNRIRLQIFPELAESLNAQAVRHMAEAAGRLQEVQDYVSAQTEKAARRCIRAEERGRKNVSLLLPEFFAEPELIQKELLRRCLELAQGGRGLKDIGSVHLEALQKLCAQPCGKSCSLPGRLTAVREAQTVQFLHRPETGGAPAGCTAEVPVRAETPVTAEVPVTAEATVTSEAPVTSEFPVTTAGSVRFGSFMAYVSVERNRAGLEEEIRTEKKYTKWLSYDTINTSLCFRTRRAGDYLVVNENGGRKKLKDYLIDQKIPRAVRDQLWLLADGSHILWVIGWRISEAAKIKQNTKKILKIRVEEELR